MSATVQAQPDTAFEKWKDGLKRATIDPNWDAWDECIQQSVNTIATFATRPASCGSIGK